MSVVLIAEVKNKTGDKRRAYFLYARNFTRYKRF